MSWNEVALYAVEGLTNGASYALVAVAISLVYGATRVINFPTGDIAAVGGLLGGSTLALHSGIPIGFALPLAMAAAGVLSIVVSLALLPPFRPRTSQHDHGWLIAAVAASIVIEEVASIIWGSNEVVVGSLVPNGVVTWAGVAIFKPAIALFVAAIVVAVALDQVLRRTRWGIRVRAAGGDPIAVAVSGIHLRRNYFEVFFVGGAIAGAAGVLMGPLAPPTAFIGFTLTIQGFIGAAIGGLGSVRGALFGGLLLGLLEAFGGMLLGSQWQDPLALLVLILVLMLRPTGIIRTRKVRAV
jgi:branched-chain amino acid transport system permease protein